MEVIINKELQKDLIDLFTYLFENDFDFTYLSKSWTIKIFKSYGINGKDLKNLIEFISLLKGFTLSFNEGIEIHYEKSNY